MRKRFLLNEESFEDELLHAKIERKFYDLRTKAELVFKLNPGEETTVMEKNQPVATLAG